MPHVKQATRKRRNANANKLAREDHPVHGWYRFVLSYPPHLVRDYLEQFEVGRKGVVLDPFCGTGTTVVECKKLGIPSIGIEANPLAAFASQTKIDWSPTSSGLIRFADAVEEEARRELAEHGIVDEEPLPLFSNGKPMCGEEPAVLRTLPPEQIKLLLKNSISPLPLHKVLVLRDCLMKRRRSVFFRHGQLALAKALVYSIGNLHFGPEVGVTAPKEDSPVLRVWRNEVGTIARDIEEVQDRGDVQSTVVNGDARSISTHVKPESISAVITSPPYPNEKDYTRTTRLESVLLGFIQNREELRTLKKGLVRSNTRSVYKGDDDDQWVSSNAKIERIARAIEKRRIELGKTSGFERQYHRVTRLYFGGMARHLEDLKQVLRPGALLAYVVGDQASYLRIMIRTGTLLAEVAESIGYKTERIDLFRTRLSTATKAQLREEVVVLRWPG